MKTVTANIAKQQLGQVLDSARTGPVSITKHGRPAFVLTSKEDYDSLVELKFEHLKREVLLGFDQLDRGEITTMSIEEIAAQALEIHRKKASKNVSK